MSSKSEDGQMSSKVAAEEKVGLEMLPEERGAEADQEGNQSELGLSSGKSWK